MKQQLRNPNTTQQELVIPLKASNEITRIKLIDNQNALGTLALEALFKINSNLRTIENERSMEGQDNGPRCQVVGLPQAFKAFNYAHV